MANVLITPTMFTRAVLANLGEGRLKVAKNMSKQYSSQFGRKEQKIGAQLSVRKPQRFIVSKGLGYQPQPISNTHTPVTVDQVAGVHFEWDSVERTLSLNEMNELYAKPAAIAIAAAINAEAAQYAAQNTFAAVGTPGTIPSAMLTYLQAGDKLIEAGLQDGEELNCIITRKMSSAYIDGAKALFNDSKVIGGQMRTGEVLDTLGYKWGIDQTLYTQTSGAFAGTPLVNGANQTAEGGNNATMSLITDGWTSTTSVLKVGDRFTIGTGATAVNSVHPQTRQDTGSLQMFQVVLADVTADGSGNKTVTIAPAITPSGQYQNVTQAPADNAAITMFGAASTASVQGLLFNPDAFAFLSVPLANPNPGAVEMVATETDPDTGVTLSFIRDFDSRTRTHVNRFDCLYGFGSLYKELSAVIAS